MSDEPSRAILSIDRSEPRFKSHTGDKITKTLKNDENFDGFVNFQLHQIQNCFGQNKKQDNQLSIEKKITSTKCLQTMLDLKMYPLPFI